MKTVTAKLKHLHIAPRKVRLIANALKGLSVNEAEAQLMFRPQRSSRPLLDLLRSAKANAQNNAKLNPDNMIVKSVLVDQGPTLKRFLPRAMGRATPLQHKTSHVLLTLEESAKAKTARFNIAAVKKQKAVKKEMAKTEKPKAGTAEKAVKPTQPSRKATAGKEEKGGFLKRMFRRKSV